ncbi:MAG: glycerate kinase [Bacteroidales bacterium]|nr:glycerate kinase [Bacteroidales bacterium]MBQ9186095.1 glycerate kinase [Bacteroidales bacterium]
MKIVIASDSFKGSLSSADVADAVSVALRQVFPDADIVKLSVADGGEGTAEAVAAATGGHLVQAEASDPLGRPIRASYAILPDNTAVIDVASASGITLLSAGEREPWKTSSFGTGELILDALDRGCRNFLIGLGGSATNDGGAGMMTALGARFLSSDGEVLQGCGCDLERIERIDLSDLVPGLRGATFTVACDVNTVFCGPDGAAKVFAPQKGAGPQLVERLDAGMRHLAGIIRECTGQDVVSEKGSGAAGGLGGAFKVFLGATLQSGSGMVLDTIGFDKKLEGADLVITGEGRADSQTPKGKTAAGVLRRAKAKGVPVILIAGRVIHCPELDSMGFESLIQVSPEDLPVSEALKPEVSRQNIIQALLEYFMP